MATCLAAVEGEDGCCDVDGGCADGVDDGG
jgi:hypothetical protein